MLLLRINLVFVRASFLHYFFSQAKVPFRFTETKTFHLLNVDIEFTGSDVQILFPLKDCDFLSFDIEPKNSNTAPGPMTRVDMDA